MSALGDYEFGSDTSDWYQREIEAPWFAHHKQSATTSRGPKGPQAASKPSQTIPYS